MNQQLEDYIKQSRQSGKTDDQIRQELLSTGWSDATIGESIQNKMVPNENINTPKLIYAIEAFYLYGAIAGIWAIFTVPFSISQLLVLGEWVGRGYGYFVLVSVIANIIVNFLVAILIFRRNRIGLILAVIMGIFSGHNIFSILLRYFHQGIVSYYLVAGLVAVAINAVGILCPIILFRNSAIKSYFSRQN